MSALAEQRLSIPIKDEFAHMRRTVKHIVEASKAVSIVKNRIAKKQYEEGAWYDPEVNAMLEALKSALALNSHAVADLTDTLGERVLDHFDEAEVDAEQCTSELYSQDKEEFWVEVYDCARECNYIEIIHDPVELFDGLED